MLFIFNINILHVDKNAKYNTKYHDRQYANLNFVILGIFI